MILSMSPSGIDSLPAMYPLKTASLTFNSAASLGTPPSCTAVCAKTRRAPFTLHASANRSRGNRENSMRRSSSNKVAPRTLVRPRNFKPLENVPGGP